MAFYPQTCPLVWGILGKTRWAHEVSFEEDIEPQSCHIGQSPDHSGEVEAVLNNRPLTHVSADVNDIDPITPSHLLYGRPIISLPYQRVEDDEIDDPTYGDDADIRKRTKAQVLLFKHFWRNI